MGASQGWDVVIVGGGLAGSCAASVLSRQGLRVVLIDPRETFPACFRAEKIEPDQAELFRKFGLLDGLLPYTSRIHEIVSARNTYVLRKRRIEQYGIFYQDMVNGVRKQMPASVTWKRARVQRINPDAHLPTVTLMGGETISARLVVLACGGGGPLLEALGIHRRIISEQHSLSIGFNIVPDGGQSFPFDSLTYYPDGVQIRGAFLTLFPIRDVMRANYFVYHLPDEEWTRRFSKEPDALLASDLPHLMHFTKSFRVFGRIEMCPIDLYRATGHILPGLVLIGDVYQGPCPTTGMGVSKVLTDVDVLGDCAPRWLSTAGMGVEKIEDFYRDPRKTTCDDTALRTAMFQRTLSTTDSLPWHVRRELRFLGVRFYSWVTSSKSDMKLAG